MAKSGKERNKKGVMRSLPRHVQAWREAEEKKRRQGMVVDDRPKFTYVEHDVCDDPNIGANAKYVYMMLSRCCDFDTKDVAMKRQELADYVGFSLPILDEALRELRDAGYVEAMAQYEDNEQIENRWVVCGPWRKYQERKLREVLERMEADPSLGLGELGMDVRLLKNLVGGTKNLEAPLPKELGSESLLDSLLDSLKDSTLLTEQPDAVAEVQAGAAEVSASVPKPEPAHPLDANEEIIIGVVELTRQQYSSLVEKAAERHKNILLLVRDIYVFRFCGSYCGQRYSPVAGSSFRSCGIPSRSRMVNSVTNTRVPGMRWPA